MWDVGLCRRLCHVYVSGPMVFFFQAGAYGVVVCVCEYAAEDYNRIQSR